MSSTSRFEAPHHPSYPPSATNSGCTMLAAQARIEEEESAMSVMQRAFKALSILAIVGAVDLSITARVLFTSGTQLEPLQLVTLILSIVLSLLLGIMGLRTDGDPVKVSKLFLLTMLAIWANVGGVLLILLTGEVIVSVIINALIVATFAYIAQRVSKEPRP